MTKKIVLRDICGVIGLEKSMSFWQMNCKNLGIVDTRVVWRQFNNSHWSELFIKQYD